MNNYESNKNFMDKKYKVYYRKKLVKYAKETSISEATREFNTTRKTVRKWVKSYNLKGEEGLNNKSRKNQYFPNRINSKVVDEIRECRNKSKNLWGSRRIIDHLQLNCSHSTVHKKLCDEGLIKKKKRRYQRRKDLSLMRKKAKVYEKFQVDIKYLTDLPELFEGIKYKNFPKYQITARDYKSGMQFIGFCYEKTSVNTGIYIDYLCKKLAKCGVDISKIAFQTDNGTEFTHVNKKKGVTYFEKMVAKNGAKHLLIPKASPTFNSDVESCHRLIEDEFYRIEDFGSCEDFLCKTHCYTLYFNHFRGNRGRDGKSPKQILKENFSKPNYKVMNINPIIADFYSRDVEKINKGGYFYCIPPIYTTNET